MFTRASAPSLSIFALSLIASPVLAQPIEGITVTASPLVGNPDTLATIVGQVNRDDILRAGGANLSDSLASIPGVSGSGFAGGASRPVIRGFDASRVRILENGVGSFDVSDIGPDLGVPIDPLSVQRIEVVRGAATLRYGSQAIGGVVNAINNRVPLVLPDKALTGEASSSYGSVNQAYEGAGLVDARLGDFALHADGFKRQTGDYDIPGGTQPNSYARADGYSGGGSYFWGESRIGAALVHYNSTYGIPSDTNFIRMNQTKGEFSSSLLLDAGPFETLGPDAGYGDYTHSEIDPVTGIKEATFTDKEWDMRAETLLDSIGPVSSAALGVQAQHRDFTALGDGADYLFPTHTANIAGFGFAEAPLTQTLKLQFGARVEHSELRGTPASGVLEKRGFTPVSASAGLVYAADGTTTFGLTATSASRTPAVTELFAKGAHDGPGTFETGDPDLTMERANSLEATLRTGLRDLRIEAALWGARFKNYIFGALTGRLCDENGACAFGGADDLQELIYAQQNADFWGTEIKFTWPLVQSGSGTLSAEAQGDYVKASLADGSPVPRITPYHLGGGLSWESGDFDINTRVTYTGARNGVASSETPTDSFVSLDAGMTWRLRGEIEGASLSLMAKNLTDSVGRNAVSLNKDDVVLPGRDIRLNLRYRF